ncbi:8-amino-3,8-dideoxy-manno-octulosonate cytidylyltransferase [Campylobacter majalis]|uniref:8-amino-3,8-dideoxy-manno-octulosonate cytidylyltransferase n=1 Tax=Campylobacter majalis TaxID=2790656 RepID=A0ABN7K830_9BACT|nr:3-deoxy-manno-octulosonate cytidylyltransferase [Campylobacter majalis]CAD7288658.1 8-amino-3,8-dideoxy-manno-octulosonate cytidylyltransferase [Campylobacter majalis]
MIIIPARLGSTRFKDKILADIFGVPMFVATAKNVSKVDDVVVAVDDEKVKSIATSHGIKAVMTDTNHQSGTDRIRQAAQILGLNDDELIINVQADEPFIEAENIKKFKDFCDKNIDNAFMFSCYKSALNENIDDKNLVKVITDINSNAIYFSRSRIPFNRDEFSDYKIHLGIYAYRVKNLKQFCTMPYSVLENTEKLEQLRALENGKKIAMLQIQSQSIGIDSPDDLAKALAKFA